MGNAFSNTPSGDFVKVHGKRLHYRIGGDENARPVILIHGASGSLLDFTYTHFDELAKSYRVLAFDRPGLGFSDPARTEYSLSEQAQLMRDAATALGITRATLVGHSYGAAVAMRWALDAPGQVDALVLLSGVLRPFDSEPNVLYDLCLVPVLGVLVSALVPLFANREYIEKLLRAIFAPQAVPANYFDHVITARTVNPRCYRTNCAQIRRLPDELRACSAAMEKILCPIYVTTGALDKIVYPPAQSIAFAEQVPAVKLKVLENVGHMPHHALPHVLYKAISAVHGLVDQHV